MKQIIIYRERLEQCYLRMKELKLRLQDCLLISNSMGKSLSEKLRGYYLDVMQDRIKLDGLTKELFDYLYTDPEKLTDCLYFEGTGITYEEYIEKYKELY